MKKVIILFLIFTSFQAVSQDYKNALGVRGGWPSGVTFKTFIAPDRALEGILSGYRGGFEITGLYELHQQAFDVPYLKLYYGPGMHIGLFSDNVLLPSYYHTRRGRGFLLGLDAVLGIEYTFTEVPFVVGFDLKPALDLSPQPFLYLTSGLSVRWYFK